jgi:hypothetical protein
MKILKGANWNGTSTINQQQVQNLESAMDFDEHVRIIQEAHGVLSSFKMDALGEGTEKGLGEAKLAFSTLKACYESKNGHVVYVSKGIHQPTANPHMQLKLAAEGKESEGSTFHLDVSAAGESYNYPEELLEERDADRFIWKGVQFSYVNNKLRFAWPKSSTPVIFKKGGHRRRQSISLASHNERLHALDEAKAVREQRLREEKEKRERDLAAAQKLAEQAKREEAQAAAQKLALEKAREDAVERGKKRGPLFKEFFEKHPNFSFVSKLEKTRIVDHGMDVTITAKPPKTGGTLRYDGEAGKAGRIIIV